MRKVEENRMKLGLNATYQFLAHADNINL